ncbi:ParM/StbA family protein [Candidatus Chloroploca sp. Khr17]|uniref:ParM/StbA family protein n=1 Tax=Candidatus Chloroploca sp. Khr17 TaxID=2496869 RepID=UPI00101D1397|nr:ParM/StbA family protein [Candidatus Chloroploca sp. Khr17]
MGMTSRSIRLSFNYSAVGHAWGQRAQGAHQMTTTPILIAADIGNVTTKYRHQGGAWAIAPSLVRMLSSRPGYCFITETPVQPWVYLSGPAGIEPNTPYLVGHDAQRAGVTDVALIGSAELRAQAPAYLLLHLAAIVASLPAGVTRAQVIFAGGLPVADDPHPQVRTTLHQRLTGKTEPGSPPIPHVLQWGATTYTVTIMRTSFIPQPIGALATLLFTPDGRIAANGALLRQRYVLDIGGGTTDFTGRQGLDLIPGSEGGLRLGVQHAAETARVLIQRRFPRLRHLEAGQVLTLLRQGEATITVAGAPCDVRAELQTALHDTASAILAQVLPRWERTLAQGEVLLCGGGGQVMAPTISALLAPLTSVTLLSDALIRVADGIERLATYRVQGQ